MSEKKNDCGNHKRDRIIRRILGVLLFFVIIILITILVIWLVLRPTKPRFYLQDAAIYQLNLSSPPSVLTTTIQATIASRNPNSRIGIYYDRLDVYATYKSQQITILSRIQPSYQSPNQIEIWSPYLTGNAVPIAPYLSLALSQDESSGLVLLYVKIDGRVRWKVGSWISGTYHLNVDCPALLGFNGGGGYGGFGLPPPSIKFQQMSGCSVSV